MNEDYGERFGGIGRLYGLDAQARLKKAHIGVVGIGGVGSWTVEALARTGVGRLTIVDLDDVCVTNTNRQLHALDGTVGKPKIEVMAQRVARIHPGCEVRQWHDFFTESTAEEMLSGGFDALVDAIDHAGHKALMIARCRALGIPIITVGGAGGRRDPAAIRVGDLTRTQNDGLLRKVRRILRREHGLPDKGPWNVPTVFSMEKAVYPTPDGGVCDKPVQGTALQLDCNSGFGTASFVTGAFGFAAAAEAIRAVTETS